MNLQLLPLLDPLKSKLRAISTPAERTAFENHINEGAPGLLEYLQSERSHCPSRNDPVRDDTVTICRAHWMFSGGFIKDAGQKKTANRGGPCAFETEENCGL